jgi:RNA polymerase sigma-70 factor, ECF subfamily
MRINNMVETGIMFKNEQTDKLSDEEIVGLVLSNQGYFLIIINRYKQKLFNFIRRITNAGVEDAEDLLQEVFLKIYLNLNDFDRDQKFSSWAYAIARNQVISNHRKIQSRPEGHAVGLDDEGAEKIISNLDISKNVDSGLTREKILRIMDGLKEKYREILILKFFEDKSYDEISDIIKKPVGTVGSMMNKAKKEFKEELERQNIKL